jgi:hypothetical protein
LANLTFTDAIGTVTFDNGLAESAGGVGSRFSAWVPFQRPIGPATTSLGTGARYQFVFRTDYGASFEIRDVPVTLLPRAIRLQAHLESGGTVRVDTNDAYGRIYGTCCLAPGATVEMQQANATDLTYSLSLALINLDAAPMLCDYSPVIGPDSVLFDWDVSEAVTGGTFARTGTATFVGY